MVLIAESGSTKTDWVFLKEGIVTERRQGLGINPFYQDTDSIFENIGFLKELGPVRQIFFYGAGCANKEKKQVVMDALLMLFPNANCEINSDLLAAARSLCGREKGIACILGTGSNSCLYNGESIVNSVSPLGYVLGDEGSGAVLGKKIVSDVLKNQAPKEISESFFEKYSFTAAEIIHRVYKQEFPNRFLAQFTVFIAENIDNQYISQLVRNGFMEFFERNIRQYNGYGEIPIHFTGSIAHYFKNELAMVAQKSGCTLGKITQSPLEGLIRFHLTNGNNS